MHSLGQPSEIAKEWLAYAERDFLTAEHLAKTLYPIPIEIVCYHCQQSAEKFLKGFIADLNKPLQKTHDLRLLVSECAMIKSEFKSLEQECARLAPYGVQARYPFAIDIQEEDMRLALSDANEIMQFVMTLFK